MRCLDCAYLDLNDRNKYDEAYCNEIRKYTELDSYTCRYFTMRDEPYRTCFLTTAFCEIKGYDDDCYELQTLRKFRNEYIANISEGQSLLEEYMVVGPKIADKIIHDDDRETIADEMGINYIYPAIELINNNRLEEAKDVYVSMVNMLKEKYNINEKRKSK